MKFRIVQSYLSRFSGLVKLPQRVVREVTEFVTEVWKDESFTSGERRKNFEIHQGELPYARIKLKKDPFEFTCLVYYDDGREDWSGWQKGTTIAVRRKDTALRDALKSTLDHELIHLLQENTLAPRPNRAINQTNFKDQGMGGKYKTKLKGDNWNDDNYYQGDVEYQPHILSLARSCIIYVEDRELTTRREILDAIKHYFDYSKFLKALKKETDQRRYRDAYKKAWLEVVKHFEGSWTDRSEQEDLESLRAKALETFKNYTKYVDDDKLKKIVRQLEIAKEQDYLRELITRYPNWETLRYIYNAKVRSKLMNKLRPLTTKDVNMYGDWYQFAYEFSPPPTESEIRAIAQSNSISNIERIGYVPGLGNALSPRARALMLERAAEDQDFLLKHLYKFTDSEIKGVLKKSPPLAVIKNIKPLERFDVIPQELKNFTISPSLSAKDKLKFYFYTEDYDKFFDLLLKTPEALKAVAGGNSPIGSGGFYAGDFGGEIRGMLRDHILEAFRNDEELPAVVYELSKGELKDLFGNNVGEKELETLLAKQDEPRFLSTTLKLDTIIDIFKGGNPFGNAGPVLRVPNSGPESVDALTGAVGAVYFDPKRLGQDYKLYHHSNGIEVPGPLKNLEDYISGLVLSREAVESLEAKLKKAKKGTKFIEDLENASPNKQISIFLNSLTEEKREEYLDLLADPDKAAETREDLRGQVEISLKWRFGEGEAGTLRKILTHPKLRILE